MQTRPPREPAADDASLLDRIGGFGAVIPLVDEAHAAIDAAGLLDPDHDKARLRNLRSRQARAIAHQLGGGAAFEPKSAKDARPAWPVASSRAAALRERLSGLVRTTAHLPQDAALRARVLEVFLALVEPEPSGVPDPSSLATEPPPVRPRPAAADAPVTVPAPARAEPYETPSLFPETRQEKPIMATAPHRPSNQPDPGEATVRQQLEEASANSAAVSSVVAALQRANGAGEAVRAALETVRAEFGWTYGSFWSLDASRKFVAFAEESGSVGEEFRLVTRSARFVEGEGLCGRAWRARDLVFVSDLGDVTDCVRAPVAKRSGIKSGVCFPILTRSGELLGTMDFLADQTLTPSPERLAALRTVGSLVSSTMETLRTVTRMQGMLDNVPSNIMLTDLDLRVTYMNPASKRTLEKLERFIPVKAADMIGTNIDVFHKRPEMQRKLLADPKNLPHRARIQIGPELVDQHIVATYDEQGRYSGPMLVWELVTEKVELQRKEQEAREREAAAQAELKHKIDLMLETVNAAAKGDLTRDVAVRGEDSLGQMGDGLAKFLTDLRKSVAQLGDNSHALASSSEELTAVSQAMSSNAVEASAQANVVSAAAEQVSKNVTTVATGVEEMNVSIKEIAKSASDAARVATSAVKVAERTNVTVGKLGESSAEIGKVIRVITSIAQQTKLLALNATIEAARAGEAGKGFAVVANEVKELAKETAKATEEISEKIEAIQADTKGAVDAIDQISAVINQINDIQASIASAVDEQTATANEISRNISEAAKGSAEIAQNITNVAQAAKSTSVGANDTQRAADELARMAAEMQKLIGKFKV